MVGYRPNMVPALRLGVAPKLGMDPRYEGAVNNAHISQARSTHKNKRKHYN